MVFYMLSYPDPTPAIERFRKRVVALAFIAVLGFATVACGSNGGDFNDADVAFAQQMVIHHEQAIDMAKLAPTRAASADVKDLAKRIEAAQDPEITQMKGWLEDWDKPMSAKDDMGGHDGMDDGAGTGMMTKAEMGELTAAEGAKFDTMFLEMMTKHHEGAIEMAKTELADGKNADAKKLAQKIIDAQTNEIGEMKTLLTQV